MNCLIPASIAAQWKQLPRDLLVAAGGESPDDVRGAMRDDVEILVADAMPTDASCSRGLRWIQLLSAGTEQLVGHPLIRRDVRVSSAAGVCAIHMAEHVVACLLHHARSFDLFRRLQTEARWPDRQSLAATPVRGTRALIVGYGAAGRETARLLHALGMNITAVTSDGARRPYRGYLRAPGTGDVECQIPERVIDSADILHAVSDVDVIVSTIGLSAVTRHMISATVFDRTKPSAILINVSRGGVVDSRALVAALDAGRLAHAYLDVFEEEPLPPDSALWRHPKITVTPHMSGVLPANDPALEELFLKNLALYRSGQPLLNELDVARFQR